MNEMEHILERRAMKLASALQHRKQLVRDAIAPPGERPPFHKQLTRPEALDWWTEHRYDELGGKVISQMNEADVQELDLALANVDGTPLRASWESSDNGGRLSLS